MNTQYIRLNMVPAGVLPVMHVSQFDIGRPLGVVVYDGSAEMDLDDYTVTIEATRTDGTPITAAVTTDGNIGAFVTTATMTNKDDLYPAQLVIVDGDSNRVASLPFMMRVVKAAMDENSEAIEEDAPLYQQYNAAIQAMLISIRADLNAEVTARQNAVAAEAATRAAADTTLQANINAEASTRTSQDTVLQAQIDQLIAPTGTAPSAAEIENARIGADGITYSTLGDAIRTQINNINDDVDDILIKWNIIDTCTIAEKTYDNSGNIQTNTTFYTCKNIPISEGQVYYAYSVYTHASPAYNHKVRKVNFYNGDTFVSALEYVNTWTVPANVTKMNVSMAYINNSYSNGRSSDDFITIYPAGERVNRLNIPDGTITEPMFAEGLDATPWNAIKQGTVLENTFIRPDGTQTTSSSFYCVKDIPVNEGDVWFAYSAYLNGGARFVTFYNSTAAIGGYEYIKSWTIPANAVSMAVTFNYVGGIKSPLDYATSKVAEIIEEIQTSDKHYGNMETRVATINFQFDDGNIKDAQIFNIFNTNSIPCGFALISTISADRVPEYLMYQRNGFEILSHSTSGAGMSDPTADASDIDARLRSSKKILEGYGFNIRGWVTPYSEMAEVFVPLMARYYDFGTTISYGQYDGSGTPYQTKNAATTRLFRVSLQSTTLENQKKAVDQAIANNGFLTFYGHSADLDGTDNETTANLNSLLSYINSKRNTEMRCKVLKPSDAVDYYFHVRHSDYLELANQ